MRASREQMDELDKTIQTMTHAQLAMALRVMAAENQKLAEQAISVALVTFP